MSDVIRVGYEQLEQIARTFEDEGDRAAGVLQRLSVQQHKLRLSWLGDNATAFHLSLDQELMPGIRHLTAALQHGAVTIREIALILHAAEAEAAAQLRGMEAAPDTSDSSSTPSSFDPTLLRRPPSAAGYMTIGYQWPEQGTEEPPTPTVGAQERSDEYSGWSAELQSRGEPYEDIHFFDAAAQVTTLLGIVEREDLLMGISDFFLDVPSDEAQWFLEALGQVLYLENQQIYTDFLNGEYFTAEGLLISPFDPNAILDNTTDWDIHMVWNEQALVGDALTFVIQNGDFSLMTGNEIDFYLNIDNQMLLGGDDGYLTEYLGDTAFLDTARQGLGVETITFSDEEHRRAMGIALVFDAHGYTPEQAAYYIEQTRGSDEPVPLDEVFNGPGQPVLEIDRVND